VAVVLCEVGAQLYVLVLRRAKRASDPWSGQVCLPGGHCEAHESAEDAARRETCEETALCLCHHHRTPHTPAYHAHHLPASHAHHLAGGARGNPPPPPCFFDCLGALPTRRAPGRRVHALLFLARGHLRALPALHPNAGEIAAALWQPLGFLLAPDIPVYPLRYDHRALPLYFPAIQLPAPHALGAFHLWGLTLRVLLDFALLLLDDAHRPPAARHNGGESTGEKEEESGDETRDGSSDEPPTAYVAAVRASLRRFYANPTPFHCCL
jgi:8-oxo-dGTP pyrophosphatase MutT (NUDIX family)